MTMDRNNIKVYQSFECKNMMGKFILEKKSKLHIYNNYDPHCLCSVSCEDNNRKSGTFIVFVKTCALTTNSHNRKSPNKLAWGGGIIRVFFIGVGDWVGDNYKMQQLNLYFYNFI